MESCLKPSLIFFQYYIKLSHLICIGFLDRKKIIRKFFKNHCFKIKYFFIVNKKKLLNYKNFKYRYKSKYISNKINRIDYISDKTTSI